MMPERWRPPAVSTVIARGDRRPIAVFAATGVVPTAFERIARSPPAQGESYGKARNRHQASHESSRDEGGCVFGRRSRWAHQVVTRCKPPTVGPTATADA